MRRVHHSHPTVHPDVKRTIAAGVLTAALLAASLGGTGAGAAPARAAADPAVINFWNGVAVDVIVVDAGKANAEAFLWVAFTQAAVYNAVVGITGRYEPYKWDPEAPEVASPEAAAATAAYRVLLEYFPASEAKLNAAYETSLDGIPDGDPKEGGIRFGERAAAPSSGFGPTTAASPTSPSRSRRGPASGAPRRRRSRRSSIRGWRRCGR